MAGVTGSTSPDESEWTGRLVDSAVTEDVGDGDWTTLWTVPEESSGVGHIIAKAAGVIAGSAVAEAAFRHVDPSLQITALTADGMEVAGGTRIMRIEGAIRSILTGERVALNFAQRLSGIATLTRRFVDAVSGTRAVILDTRKTTPGMRFLEKAAVRAGGGENHRFGLHDMILIKENHISAAGGIAPAVKRVRERNERGLRVEVEVTSIAELEEALRTGVDRILFDNMDLVTLRQGVARVRSAGSAIETEASGGVDLETVSGIALTGVDYISVGALTHSAPALDLSLLLQS